MLINIFIGFDILIYFHIILAAGPVDFVAHQKNSVAMHKGKQT